MSPSKRRRPAKNSAPRVSASDLQAEVLPSAPQETVPQQDHWDEPPAPEPVYEDDEIYADAEPAAQASAFVAPEAYRPAAARQDRAEADFVYAPAPAASAPVVAQQPQEFFVPRPAARGRDRMQSVAEERIGDILRQAREARREDLLDISDYLRIRPNFLASLEACQYEDLPADAYVIGFLRTYAVYLGLDGKKMIDHYRREMAGRRRKPQLSMPQPVSEGRAPTVAILIAAALAALAVYGLWYVLATSDRAEVSVPPALPEVAAVQPEQVPLTAGGVAPLPTPSVADAPAPAADQQAAPAEDAAAPPTTDGIMVQGVPTDVAASPAPATKADKTDKVEKPVPADKAPPADKTPPADDAAKPKQPEGQSFGASAPGHVVIKSIRDSWVLITDSHGNTRFDKTLKAGDSYNVPDDAGLTLTTGNASGLVLTIDAVPLPAMASGGRVVRAIPLEPERLKSRISEMNAR